MLASGTPARLKKSAHGDQLSPRQRMRASMHQHELTIEVRLLDPSCRIFFFYKRQFPLSEARPKRQYKSGDLEGWNDNHSAKVELPVKMRNPNPLVRRGEWPASKIPLFFNPKKLGEGPPNSHLIDPQVNQGSQLGSLVAWQVKYH